MMLDLSPAFDNTDQQVLIKRLKQQVSKSGPAFEQFTLMLIEASPLPHQLTNHHSATLTWCSTGFCSWPHFFPLYLLFFLDQIY